MNKKNIKGYFITGTDTGVGKTLIASALLILLKQKGFKTLALKPIATGCLATIKGLRNTDACLLKKHMTEKLLYKQVNPIAFYEPIAPHIAAQNERQELTVNSIVEVCRDTLNKSADFLIIEGVGGWLVPLNFHETTADLVVAFGYPVILVIGMRIGCINHTLLTIESMEKKQIKIAGWIANTIQPKIPYLTDTIKTLKQYIPAPLLGVVPYLEFVDPSITASYLELDYHNEILTNVKP